MLRKINSSASHDSEYPRFKTIQRFVKKIFEWLMYDNLENS